MALPDREYYSLQEVADRWNRPVADIQHYAETGKLEVCVRLLGVHAEAGNYEKTAQGNFLSPTYRKHLTGHYPLRPKELYEVFRRPKIKLLHLDTREGEDYFDLDDPIIITRDDVAIMSAEIERFERIHGIGAEEQFRTGLPGRPSAKDLIQREFERRASVKECQGKVKHEAEALLNWYNETYPHGISVTSKTIENNIRSRFRQLFGTSAPKL